MFPPKSSSRLRRILATLQRPARALRICGRTLARTFGTARSTTATTSSATTIPIRRRPSGPAPLNWLVSRSTFDEREREQEQRRLHDRLGSVVDRARGDCLRRSARPPLQEAQVHPDPAGRARHGQVDELDRRLQHDAGQKRERRATAPRTEIPDPMNAALREDQPEDTQASSASRSSSAIVPNPMSASLLISR